jgi:hypothetical protein
MSMPLWTTDGPPATASVAAYVPPDSPEALHPPGSEDFEQTAIAWLLDIVPPECRSYGILRRHPAALASMARYHTPRRQPDPVIWSTCPPQQGREKSRQRLFTSVTSRP